MVLVLRGRAGRARGGSYACLIGEAEPFVGRAGFLVEGFDVGRPQRAVPRVTAEPGVPLILDVLIPQVSDKVPGDHFGHGGPPFLRLLHHDCAVMPITAPRHAMPSTESAARAVSTGAGIGLADIHASNASMDCMIVCLCC